jgi:hypothetical protein
VKFRRELPVAAGDCWGLPILGHPNRYRIDGSAARYGEGIFDGYADAGIGLNYCRRFVDHYISSNDGLVVRLGCSNSHAVGAR